MIDIDQLDAQILMWVQKYPQVSNRVIAEELNVSQATVRRRIQRLVDNGAVRFLAYVDPHVIGLTVTAMIFLSVGYDSLDQAIKKLGEMKEIIWLAATSGQYNIVARGHFTTSEQLYTFLKTDIALIEGVRNSEMVICLHVEKALYQENTKLSPPQLPTENAR